METIMILLYNVLLKWILFIFTLNLVTVNELTGIFILLNIRYTNGEKKSPRVKDL